MTVAKILSHVPVTHLILPTAEQTQPLCTLQSQRRPAASGLPMAEPLRAQAAETAAVRFAGLSCLLQLTGLTQTDKLRVRPD